ncbi:MAG: tRNA (adenosine(37)-N6)-threonylcarbamoyltransferase complex dimerization subunit type 1 TsaB [Pseudomonadota bacterium]
MKDVVNILLVDTTTEACSCAILHWKKNVQDDNQITEDNLFYRYQVAPRKHAELILPMIDELFDESELQWGDLHALAFIRGPGAFTGVRIGTGIIQGLSLATKLPVIGLSSLQLMAQGAHCLHGAEICLSAIDARMDELYWGEFQLNDAGIMALVGEEQVISPEKLNMPSPEKYGAGKKLVGVGTGWAAYKDILQRKKPDDFYHLDDINLPNTAWATAMLKHAWETQDLMSTECIKPIYLRNQVAKKPSNLAIKK